MRFFAAEGVLQGHKVFVVLGGVGGGSGGAGGAGAAAGWGERWGRDLPGLAAGSSQTQVGKKQGDDDDDHHGGGGVRSKKEEAAAGDKREKMKIAWRYERLGEFGGGGGGLAAGSRGTKYVSFPDLFSLVHSEKPAKKKAKKIIPESELLLQIVLFFYIYLCGERGLTDRHKPPQRQIELCRCPPLPVKLVHHPPRHLQYSVILLTLQNG